MGERAIVHVGACDDPRRRNRLVAGPALHHQRRPFRDLLPILGVFHAVIAVVRAHRLEPLSEERDVAGAVHETHVRHGMDERARVGDRALLYEIRPELARQVELDIDFQRLGDVDAAVGPLRRVVHLAIGGMTGAGVVPGFRAFEATILKGFEHRDGERGFEFFQEDPERGAHNARADEDDVRFGNEGIWHRISLSDLLSGLLFFAGASIRP